MRPAADTYSPTWFSTFLHTIDQEQTAREVDFIERIAPRAQFPRVLDLCCGPGRHALPLSARGYDVTGIDFDERAISAARSARSSARFMQDDVRNIDGLDATWDAVLIMWASFGYFTPASNRALLAAIHRRLRTGGLLILDIYNRDFFLPRQGTRSGERGGTRFTERKHIENGTLHVELTYEGRSERDRFSWQLFDPLSIAALLAATRFDVVTTCTGFDEVRPVTPDDGRMQIVAATNLRTLPPE
jgi:SAM-dependent methyltransferase